MLVRQREAHPARRRDPELAARPPAVAERVAGEQSRSGVPEVPRESPVLAARGGVGLELRQAGGERSQHGLVARGGDERAAAREHRTADREQVLGAAEETGARMPQRRELRVVEPLLGGIHDVVRARRRVGGEAGGADPLADGGRRPLPRPAARPFDERGDALERDRRVARHRARGEVAAGCEQRRAQAVGGVERRLDDARRVAHEMPEAHHVVAAGAELGHRRGQCRLGGQPPLLDEAQRGEPHDRLRHREQRVVVVDGGRPSALHAERVERDDAVGGGDAQHGARERTVLHVAAYPVEGVGEGRHGVLSGGGSAAGVGGS